MLNVMLLFFNIPDEGNVDQNVPNENSCSYFDFFVLVKIAV